MQTNQSSIYYQGYSDCLTDMQNELNTSLKRHSSTTVGILSTLDNVIGFLHIRTEEIKDAVALAQENLI